MSESEENSINDKNREKYSRDEKLGDEIFKCADLKYTRDSKLSDTCRYLLISDDDKKN